MTTVVSTICNFWQNFSQLE